MEPALSNPMLGGSERSAENRATARGERASSTVRLELFELSSIERASLEAFISARFHRTYGASLAHFCPHLMGIRDTGGRWQAGVGYTAARAEPLFLEQYLDAPVESVLGRAVGRVVARERIVEVGNLAAVGPGMARKLIAVLAHRLHASGYRWAVFTATRELRNSFRRLRLAPVVLTRADRARLRDGPDGWGSYYAHDPVVVGGPIIAGLHAARE